METKKPLNWKQFECQHCCLDFMIRLDDEHIKKNTCCPECRRIVSTKQSNK